MAASTRTGSAEGPLGPAAGWLTLRRRRAEGFTFIEMVMVVTLISILAAIALPQFRASVQLSREAVLKEDLFLMRDLIDQYYADKGYYPEALEVLVDEGYLRKIPIDPVYGTTEWEIIYEEPDPDNPTDMLGVYDVRSLAPGSGMDGTPYNEW